MYFFVGGRGSVFSTKRNREGVKGVARALFPALVFAAFVSITHTHIHTQIGSEVYLQFFKSSFRSASQWALPVEYLVAICMSDLLHVLPERGKLAKAVRGIEYAGATSISNSVLLQL